MGELVVQVSMKGLVVIDRVLPVRHLVRIGEAPDADVCFPGADVAVVRRRGALHVRGRVLEEGDEMTISLGHVRVVLSHNLRARMPREWAGTFDSRFFAVAMLVVAVGSWADAAQAWWGAREHRPLPMRLVVDVSGDANADAAAGREAALSASPKSGVVTAPVPDIADGPRHDPDDRLTGVAWYRWYRHAVPDDRAQVQEAYGQFAGDQADPAARRVLGRRAYDAEDFDTAAWHYRWLAERDPGDRDARLRLAMAERRRGRHKVEVELYEQMLSTDAGDLSARAGMAIALSRLGRLDEAQRHLDKLLVVASTSATTDLAVATIAARGGDDRVAIDALDRAFSERMQLSSEDQLELRRAVAIDPAFARLRADMRLRSLVHRHLGAAGPRPVR